MTSLNLVIFHQAAGAPITSITQYEPNSVVFTYVASAAHMALRILEHPTCVQRLSQLALKLDTDRDLSSRFGNNPASARSFVGLFLEKLRANFPMILVKDDMADPALLGYHARGDWNGEYSDFNPRQQSVTVNGPRVRDMVATAENASRFRTFQFMFAAMFVHEIGGHVLVTHLTNGRRPLTPPSMTAAGYDDTGLGESGRYLEYILWGGTMAFYQDSSQGPSQSGVPHLDDHTGAGTRRISAACIVAFTQYNFSFPLATAGPLLNRKNLRAIGIFSIQPAVDPNQRQMMARQTTLNMSLSRHAGFRVRTRDLSAVPTNPRIRLRAC